MMDSEEEDEDDMDCEDHDDMMSMLPPPKKGRARRSPRLGPSKMHPEATTSPTTATAAAPSRACGKGFKQGDRVKFVGGAGTPGVFGFGASSVGLMVPPSVIQG